MCKYQLYISNSFDPAYNLALEEYFINTLPKGVKLFYLWQNKNTVVIGRNQNPYKECNLTAMKKDEVKLIRRLSGGGAVYHDMGNLNFTFISSEESCDIDRNIQIIIDALKEYNIEAEFNGRNDIIAEERKFSGNAFLTDNNMHCHHGTLLVDVDISKLMKYLTVSKLKIESKGIDSISSRVVNLKELAPEIEIENLKQSLIKRFSETYKCNPEILSDFTNEKELESYMEKYLSWDWNYSESPEFDMKLEKKFSWGIIEILLNIENGIIKNSKIFTDSIIIDNFENLGIAFRDMEFKLPIINANINKIIKDKKIATDIQSLFKEYLI